MRRILASFTFPECNKESTVRPSFEPELSTLWRWWDDFRQDWTVLPSIKLGKTPQGQATLDVWQYGLWFDGFTSEVGFHNTSIGSKQVALRAVLRQYFQGQLPWRNKDKIVTRREVKVTVPHFSPDSCVRKHTMVKQFYAFKFVLLTASGIGFWSHLWCIYDYHVWQFWSVWPFWSDWSALPDHSVSLITVGTYCSLYSLFH